MHISSKIAVFAAAIAAFNIVTSDIVAAASIPEKTLSISTSGKGGSWFAAGTRIIQEVEKRVPGVTTQVQTGGGITNNMKVDAGQANLGMTFEFAAAAALKGEDPYKKAHPKLRYIGALFPGYLQIVTLKKSNITRFEDLFDKRISAGKIGWGGEVMFRKMLAAYGMNYDKIRANKGVINHISVDEAVAMMKDGNLDAVVSGGSPPRHPNFYELSLTHDIDLLKIDDAGMKKIFKANPAFVSTTMPKDPYRGVAGGFPAIGGYTILVANSSLSDEAAYQVTAAIYENLAAMKKDLKMLAEAETKDALAAATIAVHPGAMRYYKEKGIAKK